MIYEILDLIGIVGIWYLEMKWHIIPYLKRKGYMIRYEKYFC